MRESEQCDICETFEEAPSWRYRIFRDSWVLCSACHDLVQRGDRKGLAERSLRADMVGLGADFYEGFTWEEALEFEMELLSFFWEGMTGELERLAPQNYVPLRRAVAFLSREGLDQAAQEILSLARKLDFSVEVHGKRGGKHQWLLEVLAPMPPARIVSQIDKILAVGCPAA